MTAFTLTKHTNIRQLTVAGGYSARTGGDTIANTNGWNFTIDQDTRFGLGAPVDAATTSGSFGSITQTAASGGDIYIDGTTVWLIPYNTGSGTLVPSLAGVTISGVTCNTIGLYSALNVAPVLPGVAAGWLKVTAVSGTLPSSGTFTSDGFTYTITGAAIRGWIEVAGDDAATFTGNRLGKFQVRGEYFDLGTTTGDNTTTYQVPNNGKQLWIPSIEVQGETWTITGATWANGKATFTTSATHDMLVGMPVTITGVTPSGYNCTDILIDSDPDITDNTFSVPMADPGAYASGGSAVAYEQYTCFGTLSAGATANAVVYNENTRRGKVFWNTNATTSLALPLGVLRFNHDGTNVGKGGYLPPAGRKLRIPNVIFTNCTTAARNQNSIPHATLATRYDFTMTGAGQIDIDKATMNWYLSSTQAYSVKLTNSGFMSQFLIQECPTVIEVTNCAVAPEAAVVAVSPVTCGLNTAGTIMKNVVGAKSGSTGTNIESGFNITTSANVQIIDCVGSMYAFRTSVGKYSSFDTCPSIKLTRFHCINQRVYIANCADMNVVDTKYTDTSGLRNSAQINIPIQTTGALSSGVILGLKFVGYRAQNWGALVSPSNSRNPLKIRKIGTYDAPLETGDGPYRDMAWTRGTGTTVCTVTHVAHGLMVNDPIVVYWNTSASAISIGIKTVATVPTADTFTFTCTNGGDTSGTLSYYFCPVNGTFNSGGSGNAENVTTQRCYVKFTRYAGTSDNSSAKTGTESMFATFDPTNAFQNATYVNLNTAIKFSTPNTGQSASVYGTTWADGPVYALPDTTSYNWARTTATATATITSGYHNVQQLSSNYVEVFDSSDEAALNNGISAIIQTTTAGDTANKMRLTAYNTGATTGTATVLNDSGRIAIYMNEGTAANTHYTFTAGNPTFTGAGTLRMPTVGDQVVFESPYWIKGHTGFMNAVPVLATATIANFWIEYDIDTGSGYSGTWKTAFRQSATSVADGTAGANTVVQVAAGDNWIANGDYIGTSTLGVMNRAAKVVSGGGTTTLTLSKNHNTTFSNVPLQAWGLPNANASIDWSVGFKLKIRITTLIANTGAANTIGPLLFRTFTTDASRRVQLPLDTITLTLTGLPTGFDAVVLTAGTSTILSQSDSVAATSYSYTYETPSTVDIGIIKPGYVPFYIRNLTLGTTNASIPVSLTPDRNYQ